MRHSTAVPARECRAPMPGPAPQVQEPPPEAAAPNREARLAIAQALARKILAQRSPPA
jgi:hypothetical protein